MPDTRRNELTRVLAEIDGVIMEAETHVNEPDEISMAAKVLADMERARRDVEGELRDECR